MAAGTFRFIDLFCGIGGMRIGLERAGGTCVFSSEINKYAVKTYAANFGDVPDGDITKTDAYDIPDHEVLAAGFPCQPFSHAGVVKRNSMNRPSGMDSSQGRLFDDIIRVLRAKKPQAFILENVKNLQSIDGGGVFRHMRRRLERAGYVVSDHVIDARVVVPQHRERLFIVGFDRDVEFDFPRIRDTEPKVRDILERSPGDRYRLTGRVWAALKRHKSNARSRGCGFGYGMADLNGVSRTMSRRYYKDGAEILIPRGPGRIPRRLTPRECARLMGFPETFRIPVSDSQAYRQFGNSVVPQVVSRVAANMVPHIRMRRRVIMEHARTAPARRAS